VAILLLGFLAVCTPTATAAEGADKPGVLHVETVPPVAGARVAVDGVISETNKKGKVSLQVSTFSGLQERFHVLESRTGPRTKVVYDRILGNPDHGANGRPVVVGLRTYRLVRWSFFNRVGGAVPTKQIDLLQLRSSTGEIVKVKGPDLDEPLWVLASRTTQTPSGLVSKDIYWVVDRVVTEGAEVVNRAQHRFVPSTETNWTIQLLFYRVSIDARDALFGFPTGSSLRVVGPSGRPMFALIKNGTAELPLLPRGSYEVRVSGGGTSFIRPVSISKDQTLDLAVMSYLDVAVIGGTLLLLAVSLLLLGRRHVVSSLIARVLASRNQAAPGPSRRHARTRLVARLAKAPSGRRRRSSRRAAAACLIAVVVVTTLMSSVVVATGAVGATAGSGVTGSANGSTDSRQVPVLAYYYIWFQPTSWQRAKLDFPLLGNYSSDDVEVMRQHVRMAKAAGIDGFLVSWKHVPNLDQRLEQLVRVARDANFKLSIVYQGLDFHRDPLEPDVVAQDLQWFADQYSGNPVFGMFGQPVVVWTGTGEFTTDEVNSVIEPVQDRLAVLGSAKNVEDYLRVAPYVRGNAYYWSSVDPDKDSFYAEKLNEMAQVVHDDDGGLWIAPAAPGFDSTLLGGRRVVGRDNGRVLRRQLDVALSSSPDAVGLISWNEFSENSHIEPSEKYGAVALQTVSDVLGGQDHIDVASMPTAQDEAGGGGITGIGALVLLLLALGIVNVLVAYRRSKRPPPLRLRLVRSTPARELVTPGKRSSHD
jgi:hypothetical protein